jgi:gamma-butyrobetaine dioxygenase
VDAKRYLTATNSAYLKRLSPASTETLALQGGPMSDSEAAAFAALPDHQDLLRLRTWDDMAKDPHWSGPDLESYREMLSRYLSGAR